MRFEGILTTWNDERGFGHLEPTNGGEAIFVHISDWPRGAGRPAPQQAVSFEIETGPKGKRAKNLKMLAKRPAAAVRTSNPGTPPGMVTLWAIPAFVVLYGAVAVFWTPPWWVAAWYLVASAVTFFAYAFDKSAAERAARRTPEKTLHLMALGGGWPGALLAQQLLRHKSSKPSFRQVFWATAALNTTGLLMWFSPAGRSWLGGI